MLLTPLVSQTLLPSASISPKPATVTASLSVSPSSPSPRRQQFLTAFRGRSPPVSSPPKPLCSIASGMPPPRLPPELMADLVTDILLRIPPDEPGDLFRAALICKPWRRIIFDPAFSRRYRSRAALVCKPWRGISSTQHSPAATVSSIEHRPYSASSATPYPSVARTTISFHSHPSPPPPPGPYHSMAAPDYGNKIVVDCRHGRTLFDAFLKLIVWNPITREQHDLCQPYYPIDGYRNVALLCTADGCDHLDCRGRPFLVVYVASNSEPEVRWGSLYSSETRTWSAGTSFQLESFLHVENKPSLLAGDAVYFILEMGKSIIKYDLTERNMYVMDLPHVYDEPFDIVLTLEDGELGFVCLKDDILYLWSWQSGLDGVAGWVQRRAIELKMLLPDCGTPTSFHLNGFVESTFTIFVSTDVAIFTIELKSERVKKVADRRLDGPIIPYMSFWTPDLAEARLPSP